MSPDIVAEIVGMKRELRALKTGGNIGFGQLGYQLETFEVFIPASSVAVFKFFCKGAMDNVLPICQVLLDPSALKSNLSNVGTVNSIADAQTVEVDVSIGNNTTNSVQTTITMNCIGCIDVELSTK